ncbi:hypothetical protein [Halovivax limisalsi]|uniref:hypothetical protein n=1 Tax=Halovivax limisalsi TaxID=1453760 RepID=UPI001FFC3F3B|nr:hypothetical protein [Halovivax limisalsi]
MYDQSLYRITGHPYLLALSDEAIDRHFGASSIDGRAYETGRRYVENLRARYPVEVVETGAEKRVELSERGRRNLEIDRRSGASIVASRAESEDRPAPSDGGVPAVQSDRDRAALDTSMDVFGGRSAAGPDGDADPQWTHDHHVDLLDDARDDVGSSASFADWAKEPDEFSDWANGELGLGDGRLEIPVYPAVAPGKEWLEDALGTAISAAIDVVLNNYTQYYDPNPITIPVPSVSDIEIGNVGMAPEACAHFYDKAAQSSSSYWTRRYTAWASHYLQDMAVPLHTGMAIEQAGLVPEFTFELADGYRITLDVDCSVSPKVWLHHGFEQLVHNRYESEFREWFRGTETRPVHSPESAIEEVARVSHAYSNDVFHTIMENETAGQDDPEKWSDTTRAVVTEDLHRCFDRCGKLHRQLLLDQGFGDLPPGL